MKIAQRAHSIGFAAPPRMRARIKLISMQTVARMIGNPGMVFSPYSEYVLFL
jgi:hypothetical protein